MTEPWVVPAVVGRWIDGDTLVADLDLGWRTWRLDQPIRLLEIDTPERGQPDYAEARARAEALCPAGSRVRVTSRRLDSFGRVLGAVTLPDGRDLAETLKAPG